MGANPPLVMPCFDTWFAGENIIEQYLESEIFISGQKGGVGHYSIMTLIHLAPHSSRHAER